MELLEGSMSIAPHRGMCRSRHFWVVAVSDVDARKTPEFCTLRSSTHAGNKWSASACRIVEKLRYSHEIALTLASPQGPFMYKGKF